MPRKKMDPKQEGKKNNPETIVKKPAFPKKDNSNSSQLPVTIFLILIILVLIGLLAYDKFSGFVPELFLKQTQEEKELGGNYQVPLGIFSNPEQTQQQDPTVSWKMFDFTLASSTESGSLYSFKYPKELQVERNGDLIRLSSAATSSETQLLVNFENYDGDLAQWVEDQDEISSKAWEGKASIEVVTSSDAVFMEMPAMVRQQKMLAADMMAYVLYFKKDGRIFSISMMSPQITQEMIDFYLIFVNTFKF